MILIAQASSKSCRLTSNCPVCTSKLACPKENLNILHPSQTYFFPHSSISEHDSTVAQANRLKPFLDSFLSLRPSSKSVTLKHDLHQSTSFHPLPSLLLLPCPRLHASIQALAACPAHGVKGFLLRSDPSIVSYIPKNKIHILHHGTQGSMNFPHFAPLPTPTSFQPHCFLTP